MRNIWQAMQFVEANRHRAEQLEQRAAVASPAACRLLGGIALQRRQLAEQMHHLAMGKAVPPAEPLDVHCPAWPMTVSVEPPCIRNEGGTICRPWTPPSPSSPSPDPKSPRR